LLVAPRAELTELRLAVRAKYVLGVDRFATAGAGPQLASRATRLGQCLGLELERPALRHRQWWPDDHVDEEAEDWQHQGEAGGENMEQHAVRALAGIAECPVGEAEPEGQQVKHDDEEQRLQRRQVRQYASSPNRNFVSDTLP